MPSLKNPQQQIPNGFQYLVVETGWTPPPYSSLDVIVQKLIEHRKAQPYLTAKNGWSVDPAQVYQEVLAYNVAVCVRQGWNDYLIGGAEIVPFPPPTPLFQRAKNLAAGGRAVVAWLEEGAPTVAQELANKRAGICSGGDDPQKACPLNGKGGLESYFTVPVTNAIRVQLERKRAMKLETPSDENLGICTGCDCPLKLKVFLPIENIISKMGTEVKARLDPRCWILSEEKSLNELK